MRLGEADAGFVYATDARAAGSVVRAIELPASIQAVVSYPVAVVGSGGRREDAEEFVALLLSSRGQDLAEAGGVRTAVSRLGSILLAVVVAIALAFLLLPLVALFLRVPPGTLIEQLGSGAAVDALLVSLETSLIAHVVILGFGTPVAWVLATRSFPGRRVAIAIVELPLVLPPAVAGIALLAAFGRRGLLGGTLEVLGITLPFTQAAVVVAIVFVASPSTSVRRSRRLRRSTRHCSMLRGRSAPARCAPSAALPCRSHQGARRRLVARVRARAGGVRRDDHLRRELSRRDPNRSACDLRTARPRLRHRDRAWGALIIFSVAILIAVNLVPAWARSTSVFPTPFAPSASR